jgi:hypothetical protein
MLGDPDLIEIVHGERGILRGIEACIDQQCLVSALTLLYAGIDALAALTRPLDQPDTRPMQFTD